MIQFQNDSLFLWMSLYTNKNSFIKKYPVIHHRFNRENSEEAFNHEDLEAFVPLNTKFSTSESNNKMQDTINMESETFIPQENSQEDSLHDSTIPATTQSLSQSSSQIPLEV